MIELINVADLVDPNDPQGRTYRQVNAAKSHELERGSLVELESGARLFIVWLGRDCDQAPLYWLAVDKDETDRTKWHGGYDEEGVNEVEPARRSNKR